MKVQRITAVGFAAVAALAPACRCSDSPAPGPAPVPSESVVTTPPVPPGFDAGAALFDRDESHPYNQVHRALFEHEAEVNVPTCVRSSSCSSLSPNAPLGGPSERQRARVGGDELGVFLGPSVDYLSETAKADAVERAVTRAMAVDPAERPIAALLLQNDAWDRFDAIHSELAKGDRAGFGELTRIQQSLARLIGRLALPAERLRAIASNLPEIEAAYAELVPGIAARAGWIELRTRANERRTEPLVFTNRHMKVFGHRMVFRVLVRRPAGAPPGLGLAANERPLQPPGTRFALMASPLAIAKGMELVAVPLVTLIELRVAAREDHVARTLADVAFDVLEGRRALLTRSPRPGGGLERLNADALVPLGATCAPSSSLLIPMRSACPNCHGVHGARLTGPMTHGDVVFELEPDPEAAQARAREAKAADPAFAALRDLLVSSRTGPAPSPPSRP